jgi:hypothetical protein
LAAFIISNGDISSILHPRIPLKPLFSKILILRLCGLLNKKGVRKVFGHWLLFRQITSRSIKRIFIREFSFSTEFHYQMALFLHACAKLLRHYQVCWSECLVGSVKRNGIITVREGPRSYCGKKGFKLSDIRCSLSVVCGEKLLARSIVSNWVRSCSSRNKTAQVASQ